MVRITILYPDRDGSRFDMDYYLSKHMPWAIERLSAHKGYAGVSVERGLSGEAPGSRPPYAAICHFSFESVEEFMAAFAQHAEFLQGDIPNYTDIKPVIQISAVEISR
jgi:uncharacterized protein (TIGR02118 family)